MRPTTTALTAEESEEETKNKQRNCTKPRGAHVRARVAVTTLITAYELVKNTRGPLARPASWRRETGLTRFAAPRLGFFCLHPVSFSFPWTSQRLRILERWTPSASHFPGEARATVDATFPDASIHVAHARHRPIRPTHRARAPRQRGDPLSRQRNHDDPDTPPRFPDLRARLPRRPSRAFADILVHQLTASRIRLRVARPRAALRGVGGRRRRQARRGGPRSVFSRRG